MEDEIKVWHKYISGIGRWKKKHMILNTNFLLILHNKDGRIWNKLTISEIRIKKDEKEINELKIFNGIDKLYVKWKNKETAKKWITAIEN